MLASAGKIRQGFMVSRAALRHPAHLGEDSFRAAVATRDRAQLPKRTLCHLEKALNSENPSGRPNSD